MREKSGISHFKKVFQNMYLLVKKSKEKEKHLGDTPFLENSDTTFLFSFFNISLTVILEQDNVTLKLFLEKKLHGSIILILK